MEAMERGAEVYKNVSCVGPVDMIIEINGIPLRCDVKSLSVKRKKTPGKYYQSTLNKTDVDVYMVNVHPVTRQISWHTARIPEGLGDFWS
tara:strand:+ start:307 stop:576 length:270 start_codon:yes stop_codon:yes gene_type:complete